MGELESEGLPALRTALLAVTQTAEDEYVDIEEAASAIAAAEVVAAALGHGRDRVPPRVNTWLDRNASEIVGDDLSAARRAVDRVLAARSEPCAPRSNDDTCAAWLEDVHALLIRLDGDQTAARQGRPMELAARAPANTKPMASQERSKTVLLTLLSARGLEPNDQQLDRIRATSDDAEIRLWLARAVDAHSVQAVFGEDAL